MVSTTTNSYGIQDPIIFDRDIINPGSHYSTTTGKYTAPYDGVYEFSFYVQFQGYVSIHMHVDDSIVDSHVDSFIGNQFTAFRSSTLLLELTTGQTVHLKQYRPDSGVLGDPSFLYSYFSGKLIYAYWKESRHHSTTISDFESVNNLRDKSTYCQKITGRDKLVQNFMPELLLKIK